MGFNDRDYARMRPMPTARPILPPITKALILINVAIFAIDLITRRDVPGAMYPEAPLIELGAFRTTEALFHGHLWQFISFQFLHESVGHILFNMIGVFIFAPYVERWWGKWKFLAYYLICGAAGALFFTILLGIGLLPSATTDTPLIGASAGVFGLLFAIYKLNPGARVRLWFPPVTLTLRTLALVFAGWSVLTILGNFMSPASSLFWNAGGEAGHLGGALMGLFLMYNPWLLGKGSRIKNAKIINHPSSSAPPPLPSSSPRATSSGSGTSTEIDRILEKIHSSGIASLTEEERKILQWAAELKKDRE